MNAKLSVNVNKIATLRNARGGKMPNVVQFAIDCERFGAEGITVHPRPDERHITFADLPKLKALVQTEFNIEGNPFAGPCPSPRDDFSDYPGFLEILAQARPEQATLVPDSDAQLTSDHGFDHHLGYITT